PHLHHREHQQRRDRSSRARTWHLRRSAVRPDGGSGPPEESVDDSSALAGAHHRPRGLGRVSLSQRTRTDEGRAEIPSGRTDAGGGSAERRRAGAGGGGGSRPRAPAARGGG